MEIERDGDEQDRCRTVRHCRSTLNAPLRSSPHFLVLLTRPVGRADEFPN